MLQPFYFYARSAADIIHGVKARVMACFNVLCSYVSEPDDYKIDRGFGFDEKHVIPCLSAAVNSVRGYDFNANCVICQPELSISVPYPVKNNKKDMDFSVNYAIMVHHVNFVFNF